MTFEEFEVADSSRLREEAKARFDQARSAGHSWGGTAALLSEAQFYMSELDRREGTKITRREFRMELVIIALIGFEILLALFGIWLDFKEGTEQAKILERIEKATQRVGNMNLLR